MIRLIGTCLTAAACIFLAVPFGASAQSPTDRERMMRPLSDVIVVMPPVAMGAGLLDELLGIVCETLESDLPKIVEGL